MYTYLIIIILIIFILYYINYKLSFKENFTQNIIFLNKNDLLNILQNDDDNYYKTFFKNDLYARKISNINNYIDMIKISTSEYNDTEKNKIISCIEESKHIFNDINFEWFDGKKANTISWKLGCIDGKLYENGLPHTRNDIIIMSKENINNFSHQKLLKTLIHEKVHVYQKLYPDDLKIYINKNNFRKLKERDESDNIRANPDLDNCIYTDNKENIYKALYNSNPTSIEDIIYSPINSQSYEHPYERMAIEIENK